MLTAGDPVQVWVVRWLLLAGCTLPLVVAAVRSRRRISSASWWVAALFVAVASISVDPSEVALRRVDGKLTGVACIQ